jgi:hypothetical protein
MFDLAALEAELADTIYKGKLHFSPVTGATNTDAVSAARTSARRWAVFFAYGMSSGIVRAHYSWLSAAGGNLRERLLRLALRRRLPLAARGGLAAAGRFAKPQDCR